MQLKGALVTLFNPGVDFRSERQLGSRNPNKMTIPNGTETTNETGTSRCLVYEESLSWDHFVLSTVSGI
jgi:hypothetical protein